MAARARGVARAGRPRRAGGRHRHDRRRPQHRRQGARGPRLLRRRQPAAAAGRRRGPAGRRDPRPAAADRRRGRRTLRLVLRRPAGGASRSGSTGRRTTLLFLEANDDVLVRRQEAARRPHPLQEGGRLLDGLRRERVALDDLRADADLVIDTTGLNVHQLTDKVAARLRHRADHVAEGDGGQLRVQVRHPGRRRPGRRHAVPAQPALGARAAPAVRPRRGGGRLRQGAGPARRSSSTSTSRCSRPSRQGYLREGKRFMTVAIGCTGGKHRSVAMTEEIAARLLGRGHRRPADAPRPRAGVTMTHAAHRDALDLRVVALGGGHGLAAVAGRAAARRRRPDRGRHGGRQRRLVRPAAPRVRRAAARRPAAGAVRAVRRRRLGPHLGPGAAAPVRQRRRDGQPRGRQPADRHAVGAARRPRRRRSTGSAGCSAPRAGCCRWRSPRSTSPPQVRGLDPADPDALTTVRGQVEVASTDGQVHRGAPRARRTRPPAREALAAVDDADWVVLGPGLVVHQRDPAPAGARAAPGAGPAPRPARW